MRCDPTSAVNGLEAEPLRSLFKIHAVPPFEGWRPRLFTTGGIQLRALKSRADALPSVMLRSRIQTFSCHAREKTRIIPVVTATRSSLWLHPVGPLGQCDNSSISCSTARAARGFQQTRCARGGLLMLQRMRDGRVQRGAGDAHQASRRHAPEAARRGVSERLLSRWLRQFSRFTRCRLVNLTLTAETHRHTQRARDRCCA